MNSTRTNSHDARTMDILQQANEWILILESKEVSEHDRSEFKSWVESDRRHEDIYSQALAMKRALSELSLHDFDAELNKQMPRERALGLVAKIKVLRKKWPLWSTGFTAAVLLIGVVLFLPTLTVDENRTGTDSIQSIAVSTQVSETKSVTLDDGTVVTLAPESSINAKYTESNRQVILEKGQAFFDVIRDSSRPFSVASENLTVTVLGTAFDVRNSGTLQTVAVKEGTVEVKFPVIIDKEPISLFQKERISAGQGVQATSKEGLGAIQTLNIQDISSWREGKLTYRGAPMSELLFDANRYSSIQIVVADGSEPLLDFKVRGVFRGDDVNQIINAIGTMHPIDIDISDPRRVVLRMRNLPTKE